MTGSPRFPFDGDIDIEPDPRYARLREHCPVSRVQTPDGREAWLVVGHDDAKHALVDPKLTRSGTVDAQTVQAMGIAGPPGRTALIYADPPGLTRIRRIVTHYFDTARVESLRPRAAAIVAERLDAMAAAGGPADLVTYLARPLPITIICELLGIDGAESDRLKHDVEVLLAIENRGPDELREAYVHIRDYLSSTVTHRRGEPGDDLLSDLIGTTLTEEPLTDGELTGLAMLLFVTGHETTMTQLTNSVLTLLRHPTQWAQLVAEPDLVSTAVEELLRYVPLGHAGLPFAAREDLRLGDADIAAGDLVYISKLSANRDPAAFADADVLDLMRNPNRHIAFSHGPHFCLGAGLARMELVEALSALVVRFPNLTLGCDESELTWRRHSIQRGPRTLPVRW